HNSLWQIRTFQQTRLGCREMEYRWLHEAASLRRSSKPPQHRKSKAAAAGNAINTGALLLYNEARECITVGEGERARPTQMNSVDEAHARSIQSSSAVEHIPWNMF